MIKKNLYSILVALLLLYLSLTNSEKFQKSPLVNIPFMDKIVHLGMYFIMMSVIIIEHRKSLRNSGKLFLFALIPLSYGVLMEILQATLTVTRTGDFYDALADAAGILVSIVIWLLIRPAFKEVLK
jgi:VanZ family protein